MYLKYNIDLEFETVEKKFIEDGQYFIVTSIISLKMFMKIK